MKRPVTEAISLDEEIVLTCAFRYALGRMTYVVGSVSSEIARHIKVLSMSQLHLYVKEINQALENNAAMDMDVKKWVALKEQCEAQIKFRLPKKS